MGENNSKEILTSMSESYRGQIRLLDLVLEMSKEIKDLSRRLTELESKKGCGCRHA